MELSRRDAIRAGGALLATAASGCIEERVTTRETRDTDGTTWALNPDVGLDIGPEEFQDYVGTMEDRYGEAGVWGLDGRAHDGFDGAYVQRLALTRQTTDDPGGRHASLVPEEVDPEAPMLVADACVAVYDLGDDRYRYWLWVAADGGDSRLVRDVSVVDLGLRVTLRNGVLADAAQLTGTSGEAQATLGSPPSGSFPLGEGTSALDSNSELAENGFYAVDWNGEVEGVQSINAVYEEERTGEHDFFWTVAAGYSYERTL